MFACLRAVEWGFPWFSGRDEKIEEILGVQKVDFVSAAIVQEVHINKTQAFNSLTSIYLKIHGLLVLEGSRLTLPEAPVKIKDATESKTLLDNV